jgi:hypothetical protein
MTSTFAMIGLLLALINYWLDTYGDYDELEIRCDTLVLIYQNHLSAMHSARFTDAWTKKIRWCILLTSLISIFFLLMRYQVKT